MNKMLRIVFIVLPLLWSCAHIVAPSGGPIDEQAPIPEEIFPSNYSVHFDAKVIKLVFDEYIQVKNLETELIISPPLEKPKAIVKGKLLLLTIEDSLKANTTYTFNFGNAIVDLNEANPIEDFKYVFSTGSFIDSLQIKGKLAPVFETKLPEDLWVMAYPFDENWNDSTPFKINPRYLSKAKNGDFTLTNMDEGSYKIVAFEDADRNYLLSENEVQGFLSESINAGLDSNQQLELRCYKPEMKLQFKGAKQTGLHQFSFGFNRTVYSEDSINIYVQDTLIPVVLNELGDSIEYLISTKFDSLNVRLNYGVGNADTLKLYFKDQDTNALNITLETGSVLEVFDSLKLKVNHELSLIDTTKISLRKDSIIVPYSLSQKDDDLIFSFQRDADVNYLLIIDSLAMTDIYGGVSDSMGFVFKAQATSYYGTLSITAPDSNARLISLLDQKGNEVIKQQVNTWPYAFQHIRPGKYSLRIVHDKNQNCRWDAGNIIEQKQPEYCTYLSEIIEIRSNWDLEVQITE